MPNQQARTFRFDATNRRIVGGNFQDPLGNPLNAGYLTFQLTTDAVAASNKQVSAGVITQADLDSNGSISGTVYLRPNSTMSPSTKYVIRAFTNSGEVCWESENVVPSGAGSFDIGAWIPSY
jgi:hypothetical protein